jgi:glucose-1-phosphate adenylyltransferase
LAVFPVPWEEASRFGVVIADDNKKIQDFEEKPENPRSNLASMGIYIFTWKVLKEALIALKDQSNCDFGKHIIPYLHKQGKRIFAYEFNGYWKDVGTLGSYWESNMELIDLIPEFNLYEEFWKIYTKQDRIEPQFIGAKANVSRAIIGAGDSIEGDVSGSVLGAGVVVEEEAVVKDSIIMMNTVIHKGAYIEKAVIAEDCEIGANARIGVGESAESKLNASVYAFDLAVVGQGTVIPDGVTIGKNTAIRGITVVEDYPDMQLESGGYIIKAGDGA